MVKSIFLFDDTIISESMKNSKKLHNFTKVLIFMHRNACNSLERSLVANVIYNKGLNRKCWKLQGSFDILFNFYINQVVWIRDALASDPLHPSRTRETLPLLCLLSRQLHCRPPPPIAEEDKKEHHLLRSWVEKEFGAPTCLKLLPKHPAAFLYLQKRNPRGHATCLGRSTPEKGPRLVLLLHLRPR